MVLTIRPPLHGAGSPNGSQRDGVGTRSELVGGPGRQVEGLWPQAGLQVEALGARCGARWVLYNADTPKSFDQVCRAPKISIFKHASPGQKILTNRAQRRNPLPPLDSSRLFFQALLEHIKAVEEGAALTF